MQSKLIYGISSRRFSLLSTDFNKVTPEKYSGEENFFHVPTFKVMSFDLIICINLIHLMQHIQMSA